MFPSLFMADGDGRASRQCKRCPGRQLSQAAAHDGFFGCFADGGRRLLFQRLLLFFWHIERVPFDGSHHNAILNQKIGGAQGNLVTRCSIELRQAVLRAFHDATPEGSSGVNVVLFSPIPACATTLRPTAEALRLGFPVMR